jgi:hypothetical protein
MSELSSEAKKAIVDKVRFDAVLHRMIQSQPMPLKDVVGTSTPRRPKRKKAVQKLD